MIEAPVLRHPDLSKIFEVARDAPGIGIKACDSQSRFLKQLMILNQDGQHVAYFSEKLNEAKQRYSTYDKEFYTMVQSLRHQRYYLLPKEFILYYDHQTLHYLQSQSKLSFKHVNWVEFLQDYTFVLKHHVGVDNKVGDALSHVITVLHFM